MTSLQDSVLFSNVELPSTHTLVVILEAKKYKASARPKAAVQTVGKLEVELLLQLENAVGSSLQVRYAQRLRRTTRLVEAHLALYLLYI
jgi:hypothetical protein